MHACHALLPLPSPECSCSSVVRSQVVKRERTNLVLIHSSKLRLHYIFVWIGVNAEPLFEKCLSFRHKGRYPEKSIWIKVRSDGERGVRRFLRRLSPSGETGGKDISGLPPPPSGIAAWGRVRAKSGSCSRRGGVLEFQGHQRQISRFPLVLTALGLCPQTTPKCKKCPSVSSTSNLSVHDKILDYYTTILWGIAQLFEADRNCYIKEHIPRTARSTLGNSPVI